MGIFSELKKLFFTVESVSKTGIEKAKEEAIELKDKAADNVEQLVEKSKDKFDDLMDSFSSDTTSEQSASTPIKADPIKKSALEEVQDEINQMPEEHTPTVVEKAVKNVGEKSLELGEKAMDKFKDLSEDVGKDVLDKVEDISEKIGEGVYKAKDKLTEKAKEAMDKIGDLMDETMEKAKKMEEEDALKDTNKDGFADSDMNVGGSLLEDKKGFFDKAKDFAEGKYKEGKTTIKGKIEDTTKEKSSNPAFGFEDRDGDGDEIIDDAIIEDK